MGGGEEGGLLRKSAVLDKKWIIFKENKVIEKFCLTTECRTTEINARKDGILIFDTINRYNKRGL